MDVFTFATGASCPPSLGFDSQPKLDFVDGEYPKANTCAPFLFLPLCLEAFKEKMDFGIFNSPSFGYA